MLLDFATHFFDESIAPLSPPAFLYELRQLDPIVSLPSEFMLVARTHRYVAALTPHPLSYLTTISAW